jgi:hypothetical protein
MFAEEVAPSLFNTATAAFTAGCTTGFATGISAGRFTGSAAKAETPKPNPITPATANTLAVFRVIMLPHFFRGRLKFRAFFTRNARILVFSTAADSMKVFYDDLVRIQLFSSFVHRKS